MFAQITKLFDYKLIESKSERYNTLRPEYNFRENNSKLMHCGIMYIWYLIKFSIFNQVSESGLVIHTCNYEIKIPQFRFLEKFCNLQYNMLLVQYAVAVFLWVSKISAI